MFSMEYLGDSVDTTKIKNTLLSNGSIGVSVSATAYMLSKIHDRHGYGFLVQVQKKEDGSFPHFHDFEYMDISYTIYNFLLADMPLNESYRRFAERLRNVWCSGGVSFARSFPILDPDDTSLTFRFLKYMGMDVDPKVFETFETDTGIACYPFERNPSTAVNIHTLDALKYCNDYNRQEILIEKNP